MIRVEEIKKPAERTYRDAKKEIKARLEKDTMAQLRPPSFLTSVPRFSTLGAAFSDSGTPQTMWRAYSEWEEDRATTNPVVMLLNTNGSLQMRSGASCIAAGVWTNASSRGYKKDIEELTGKEATAMH